MSVILHITQRKLTYEGMKLTLRRTRIHENDTKNFPVVHMSVNYDISLQIMELKY